MQYIHAFMHYLEEGTMLSWMDKPEDIARVIIGCKDVWSVDAC
jgi:hypothetical protein